MTLKDWQRRLKIFLIAGGIYYLLIFIFFLLSYQFNHHPGDAACDFLQVNYDGLAGSIIYWFANSGELPCLFIASSELLFKPITIFFESGSLFLADGFIIWIVITTVYALTF